MKIIINKSSVLRSGELSSRGFEVDQVNTYSSSLPKFYLCQEGFKFPQVHQYTPEKHKNQENSSLFWCCLESILRSLVCNVILWNIILILCKSILASSLRIIKLSEFRGIPNMFIVFTTCPLNEKEAMWIKQYHPLKPNV